MPVPTRPLNLRVTPSSAPGGLFQSTDLTYLGAFKIPAGSCGGDQCTANYGGQALAYDPAGNNGLGSLFINSLNTPSGRLVGEISVETDLVGGAIDPADTTLAQMPTAKLLQPFGDIWAGQIDTISPGANNWIGGLLVVTYQGVSRLLAQVFASFGVATTHKSHFILAKSTTAPQVIVPATEVNGTGFTPSSACGGGPNCPDGWVGQTSVPIPAAYQAALGGDMLSGMRDASIIGRTSHGPSATRWNLADLANPSGVVTGKKLLGYDAAHQTLGKWTTGFDGATSPPGSVGGTGQISSQNDWNRMVWPEGYASLLHVVVMGNTFANVYGAAVAAGVNGDPVMQPLGFLPQSRQSGSVTTLLGSAAIVGIGTAFTTQYAGAASILIADGGVWRERAILSIQDDTHLTLAAPYQGAGLTTGAGKLIERFWSGTTASVDATGKTITLPFFNVASLPKGNGHGYLWLPSQVSPTSLFAGRNYVALLPIVSVANSGLANASVTVSGAGFQPNLTNQAWQVGDPACYDPMVHRDNSPDTTPSSGHGPTAYPYQAMIYAYDAADLAAVNAGTKQPWQLLPYATWALTLPITYPAGKYAVTSLGGLTIDQARRRIYLVQKDVDAGAASIVLVYSFAAGGS